MIVVEPGVELLHITPDAERVIERAGRLCWKSEGRIGPDSYKPFIRMLKSKNHESVLEHASAGFIVRTDRGITHELVRHRIASYSQTSTRYCKYEDEITVIKPSTLPGEGPSFDAWAWGCMEAQRAYRDMLAQGQAAQIARAVLPTCLMSEIAVTMNFRSWRQFLRLRLGAGAHPDIQVIATLIRDQLIDLAPVVFEDL